jgi:myo-inositol-1-phosphate synthase
MFIHIDTETGISSNEHLDFETSLRILGTACLSLMQGLDKYVKENDAENYESVHGRIYDTFNIMAGNILDAFDDNRSPATDLTAEAILRAENEILDEKFPTEVEETIELEVTPTKVEEAEATEEDVTESPA